MAIEAHGCAQVGGGARLRPDRLRARRAARRPSHSGRGTRVPESLKERRDAADGRPHDDRAAPHQPRGVRRRPARSTTSRPCCPSRDGRARPPGRAAAVHGRGTGHAARHRAAAPRRRPADAQSTLAQVTSLLARSLRGDDWLGSSGPAEFAVVLSGGRDRRQAGRRPAGRRHRRPGHPGPVRRGRHRRAVDDLTADEVLRRATVSLTAARRVGPGTVIRYREPRSLTEASPQPPRRSTAAAIRSSVAVSARRTCRDAGRAVEAARRGDDAEPGQPVDRRPAVLVAGGPQVEAGLGVVDPQPRPPRTAAASRSRRARYRSRWASTCASSASAAAIAACTGPGTSSPRCRRTSQIAPHQRRVAGEQPGPVAGGGRLLGQRVHRQQAGVVRPRRSAGCSSDRGSTSQPRVT